MPQQSMLDTMNPITFRCEVKLDEVAAGTTLTLQTYNKAGTLLAAASVRLNTRESAELLPEALRMAAFGWLCAGPREMVTDVAQYLRQEIKRQRNEQGLQGAHSGLRRETGGDAGLPPEATPHASSSRE